MTGSGPTLQGVPNFRDLGGVLDSAGCAVRAGRVYRSEALTTATDSDVTVLAALDIGAVFDLRNPSERASTIAPWPRPGDGVTVHLMSEQLSAPGADLRQFVRRLREDALSAAEVVRMMQTTYRAMPSHFGPVLRTLFDTLAADGSRPCLVHCSAGKDRTGFVCALLLCALGVPADQVIRDYLRSARYFTIERLQALLAGSAEGRLASTTASGLAELAQVKASYLNVAFEAITAGWGSVSGYLLTEAALHPAKHAALRARMLDPAASSAR